MAELVRLYKESDLGTRLPAYDGRKSLYTAGELPFAWKEFTIKLVDEDDGINGPKSVFIISSSALFNILSFLIFLLWCHLALFLLYGIIFKLLIQRW